MEGEKLTSRALKEECVFDAGYVVESIKRTIDGKVKRFQNKTPIAFILAPESGTSPNPSQGGENNGGGDNNGGGNNGGGGGGNQDGDDI